MPCHKGFTCIGYRSDSILPVENTIVRGRFFVGPDIMYWAKKHTYKKNEFFAAIPNTLGWREFSTNSLKSSIRLLKCSHLQETCSRKVSRLQKIEHPQAECKFSCYFELWSLFSNKVAKQ